MRIDHFNLRAFDLNLLLVFDALMQERSVTRAADCLKVGQPAMSHSLGTLRMLFDDALFVRIGHRMEPTLRAQELHTSVRALLEESQRLLLTREAFDPTHDERLFRIGVTTQLESLLLSPLMAELADRAPRLRILVSHTSRETVFEALDQERIDLALGYLPGGASWHHRRHLLDTEHLCCFQPAILPLATPVTRKEYERSRHALISAKPGMLGYLEESYRTAGIALDVGLAAPSFFTVLSVVASAPMIATLPARVVQHYAPLFDLQVSALPLRIPALPIDLIWHARSAGDQASGWLRDRIAAVAVSSELKVGSVKRSSRRARPQTSRRR